MFLTKKMKDRIIMELEHFKKKGYSNEQLIKLYCARYGAPEDLVMEIYAILKSNM